MDSIRLGILEDTISDNPWLSIDSWKNEDCKLENVKKNAKSRLIGNMHFSKELRENYS